MTFTIRTGLGWLVVALLALLQPATMAQAPLGSAAPLMFVKNVGQVPGESLYVARLRDGFAYVDRDSFVIQFVQASASGATSGSNKPQPRAARGVNLRISFGEARPDLEVVATQALPTHVNFYSGKDPANWREDVPAFGSVEYVDVLPGIDVVLRGVGGRLEYVLRVAPDADPEALTLRCDGADSLHIAGDGSLRIETPLGEMIHSPPHAFTTQDGEQHELSCRFVLRSERTIAFETSGWSRQSALVIDPTVAFASYLGSIGTDLTSAVATDSAGCPYVTGVTNAVGFPTTPGAFAPVSAMGSGFVTKFDPAGASLVYSTFMDGQGWAPVLKALALTPAGDAVLAGWTNEDEFTTTPGAFDPTYGGDDDGLALKLDASGGHLLWSTYIGGSGEDYIEDVAIDSLGNVVLVGWSCSFDYPLMNPFDPFSTSCYDAVITKLRPDGASLAFSTYFGSQNSSDLANAVAIGAGDRVVVAERSLAGGSHALPVSPTAFDKTPNGSDDVFVAALDSTGSTLEFCTLLGTSWNDSAEHIALAADGSIYVAGKTEFSGLPTTLQAFDKTYNGFGDGFIAHFDPMGSALLHCTYLGGIEFDNVEGLALDPSGLVVATGFTGSSGFPKTLDAYNSTYSGGGDIFLVRMDAALSKLQYGTFIGGNDEDESRDLAVDDAGAAYVVGYTISTSGFPTTPGAFDTELYGFSDGYVLKFDFSPWVDLGGGTPSQPHLAGAGSLLADTPGSLSITDAPPSSTVWLVVGLSPINSPFKNSTLVPAPDVLLPLVSDPDGNIELAWAAWPAGVPPMVDLYFQALVQAPTPNVYSVSNALSASTPMPAN